MKHLINIGKLACTGAIIFGIAFLFATQSTDGEMGEVEEANADVGWFNAGSDGHEFTRAIAAAGLEPRPYDYNGNRMYFAAGHAEGRPADIEKTMQDVFVDYDVNEENHAGAPLLQARAASINFMTQAGQKELGQELEEPAKALMRGDVMPVQRSKDYVAMVGYDWKYSYDEMGEKVASGEIKPGDMDPNEMSKGYKFLDATYEPGTGSSQVTSVWSGQDFDPKKMTNESFKTAPPDPEVPSCMGCERRIRFQSLSSKEPYGSNQWATGMGIRETADFYRTAMQNRGWAEVGSQAKIDKVADHLPAVAKIQGSMLQFEREGEMLHIALIPDGRGGTEVMSTQRYSGAKSLLKGVDDYMEK